MELTKIYKYRKCSHNKFTKAQWESLRSGNYILFERSYFEVMKRLMFMKAILHSYNNSNIKHYRFNKLHAFIEKIQNIFLSELIDLGYLPETANTFSLSNSDVKNIKITIDR